MSRVVDREQIRRDADEAIMFGEPSGFGKLAEHCLSLLAELEEAEARAHLGCATTMELIREIAARADVCETIEEPMRLDYRTVDSE